MANRIEYILAEPYEFLNFENSSSIISVLIYENMLFRLGIGQNAIHIESFDGWLWLEYASMAHTFKYGEIPLFLLFVVVAVRIDGKMINTSSAAIAAKSGKKESKENNKAPNILRSLSLFQRKVKEMPWRAQNQQIDWLAQKKSWKTKQERKSFLEVKAKYDKMKRRKYYRQNFFSAIFPFLSYSRCRFRSWLFLYFYWYSFFFFAPSSYFSTSVLFAFHSLALCAFVSFLDCKFAVECFADFFCFLFLLPLFSFSLFHYGSLFQLCALHISAQTNTHRKVLNFIQDFYLIRITYISNNSFCCCRRSSECFARAPFHQTENFGIVCDFRFLLLLYGRHFQLLFRHFLQFLSSAHFFFLSFFRLYYIWFLFVCHWRSTDGFWWLYCAICLLACLLSISCPTIPRISEERAWYAENHSQSMSVELCTQKQAPRISPSFSTRSLSHTISL